MTCVLRVEGVRHGIVNVIAEKTTSCGVDSASRVPHPLDQKGEIVLASANVADAAKVVAEACDQLLQDIDCVALTLPKSVIGNAEHVTASLVERSYVPGV